VPYGGTVQNATTLGGFPVDAQIFINNGANVTLSNLTLDGRGNGVSTCGTELMGIYFQNASGTVTQSAVLNEILPTGYTGCQAGEGIFAESNTGNWTVAVSNTIVENFQKNGITGNGAGTILNASNNTIIGVGPTNGAAQNGVQIAFGAAGTITSNTVANEVWGPDTHQDSGDAASGILVYGSTGIHITSNQVTNTQYGIVVVSDTPGSGDGATIKSNTVNATHIFDAIDACSNGNTVSSNTINGADQSGIHLDDTCGGTGNNNTVNSNTISLSCTGLLTGTGTTGNIATGNTYYNVITQTTPGDVCEQVPGPEKKPPHRPKVRPARH
jgi:parallel beta-helix repeat protein